MPAALKLTFPVASGEPKAALIKLPSRQFRFKGPGVLSIEIVSRGPWSACKLFQKVFAGAYYMKIWRNAIHFKLLKAVK